MTDLLDILLYMQIAMSAVCLYRIIRGPTIPDRMVGIDIFVFTICPWWDGPESCTQVGDQLERDSQKIKDRWIWVYHAPPDASPTSWGGKQHFGDTQLVQWIERFEPDMVF